MIDLVHGGITDLMERAYEGKKTCSAIFLDMAQAFDKGWYESLMYKLQKALPKPCTEVLELYIS